jgi:fatty acid desaturase/rubredoxin
MQYTLTSKYRNDRVIDWYRTPVDPALLRELNERSDAKGLAQAGGFLALIVASGAFAVFVQHALPWPWLIPALLLHGTFCAFMSNAVHEFVHGTVFRTPWLNAVFLNLFSFLRWFPYDYYWASHTEHHKFTLHPPVDREVVLPTHFTIADWLKTGFLDPVRLRETLLFNLRLARGRLEGDWEHYLLAQDPARFAVFRWARILLVGHFAVVAVSLSFGNWIIPVLVSLPAGYGGWLFYLCNNSQHAGLRDKVADFRLNCRTIMLKPFLGCLYWHMNYHTEHHMYAAVPCYNLRRLHDAIKHDLPHPPVGLVQTWRQILAIQRRQEAHPGYQFNAPLPAGAGQSAASLAAAPASLPGDAETAAASAPGRIWQCSVCGFIYAERLGLPQEGIAPGTAWDDIPDDWTCPDCGTSKADFQMVEVTR